MSQYEPLSQNHDPAFIDACAQAYREGQSSLEDFRKQVAELQSDVANLKERSADIDNRLRHLEEDISVETRRSLVVVAPCPVCEGAGRVQNGPSEQQCNRCV
jgi:septal ring factor EnvC (AmiA/AmiB activator)